jgi:hypothetical protein
MSKMPTRLVVCALLLSLSAAAFASAPADAPIVDASALPAAAGPPTGLADSAALRATVFGTPPQDMAPLPETVPLSEINIALPWARPVPAVYWFDRKLRVWISAQKKPAPLAIVIAGTGGDGNTSKLSILRGALYAAGYHVLTMPSPTFPGFIVSTSSTGVSGDLMQDSRDLYAAIVQILAQLPRRIQITDIDILGYSLGGANAAVVKSIDAGERQAAYSSRADDQSTGELDRVREPSRQAVRDQHRTGRCRRRAPLSTTICATREPLPRIR